jgi:predicted aspartyl protease
MRRRVASDPLGDRPMKFLAMAAAAAALLAPLQARAACQLKSVNVPVTMRGLRPLVTAKVSGQDVKFILDSGAFFSYLDGHLAAQLKLKPVTIAPIGSHLGLAAAMPTTGVGGQEMLSGVVTAPHFQFAGASFNGVQFLTTTAIGDGTGLLGQNLLHQVDDEYDFKNGMLRLIQPDGCETSNLAYWAKPGSTYSEVALEPSNRDAPHTIATIEINGVKMRAHFDTGADTSFITARAAARAGVHTDDPGVVPAGVTRGLDRNDIKTWVGRFADIKIGDEEIKNTRLEIGQTEAEDFDVLIGADFFLAHHVYVANSQGKIYFTYAGGPVFRTPEVEPASGEGKAAAK